MMRTFRGTLRFGTPWPAAGQYGVPIRPVSGILVRVVTSVRPGAS